MSRSIFNDIILPLARSWSSPAIRNVIKEHLVILKPDVFPSLYKWVSYPISLLIKSIYEYDITRFKDDGTLPCPLRLEFLACLERLLCFCHTGNTAVLATSLMHPLGLSHGVLKDGFPTLFPIFKHPTIHSGLSNGFQIDPCYWPLKDGYPAVASKRAQVLTYSLQHYPVRIPLLLPTIMMRQTADRMQFYPRSYLWMGSHSTHRG
jgi:hypothetical protein